jgi:uncharacterized coiled-coil DUF342 family protein
LPVEDTVLSAVVSQASKRILERLEKGKKLTAEDLLLLYLDLVQRELRENARELREEVRAARAELLDRLQRLEGRLDAQAARLEEATGRLAAVEKQLGLIDQRLGETREEVRLLRQMLAGLERRIDRLYELAAGGGRGRGGEPG